MSWSINTTATQHRIHFLRELRNNHLTHRLLPACCRCSVESFLTYCVCVWLFSCIAAERTDPQRASKITGCPLPSLDDPYSGLKVVSFHIVSSLDLSHKFYVVKQCLILLHNVRLYQVSKLSRSPL